MNICFIGKYPPLEGQVSTLNYWLARGLASRGHHIIVCTNSNEAPAAFRTLLSREDDAWLDASFPSGSVSILQTAKFDRHQFHIPPDNPSVSKLAALGLCAIVHHKCSIVFANYLEPYGVAAHLVSAWSGARHIQTHAGSDVGRLAAHPQLRPVYRECVHRAEMFVAKNQLARALSSPLREFPVPLPYAPPSLVFHLNALPLDVDAVLKRAKVYIEKTLRWHVKPFRPNLPTFGFYGKLFEAKGIFELVQGLGQLKAQKFEFNLLLMTRWRRGERRLVRALIENGLENDTWMLPMLPNWHVAGFIRCCVAVAYLNRSFGMPLHSPIIPDEILSCGRCLIVSGEVQRAPRYRDLLRDGDNCFVVQDPRNLQELVRVLRRVLERQEDLERLGRAGALALAKRRCYEDFVSSWERIFLTYD